MNVIEKIIAANYRPTDSDVEQLAFAASLGISSKGTFLRVLAAGCAITVTSASGTSATTSRG